MVAMKVKEIMTKNPATCTPDTTLAEAAHLMWEADCGILPVVEDGEIEGVVTDRDMYVALATRNMPAANLKVGAVATKTVISCAPEDDVQQALDLMRQALVRRLPVLGFGGTVLGIVSMNDIVLAADVDESLTGGDVLDALKTICGHHHPVPHVVAA
jgi:CBS domain-containing protein